VLDGLRHPPAVLRPGGVTAEELGEYPGLEQLGVRGGEGGEGRGGGGEMGDAWGVGGCMQGLVGLLFRVRECRIWQFEWSRQWLECRVHQGSQEACDAGRQIASF
jgi:hypothetical protein